MIDKLPDRVFTVFTVCTTSRTQHGGTHWPENPTPDARPALGQIVTGIMPVTRGNLPEPLVPDECPQDVLYLIHDCTAADPGLRPTAKEVGIVDSAPCQYVADIFPPYSPSVSDMAA